jgi:hypothetical protein
LMNRSITRARAELMQYAAAARNEWANAAV